MGKKYLMIKVISFLLVCYPSWVSGQKTSDKMLDAITYIVGDTLNPEIYIVPVMVKFANDTQTWVGFTNALFLYKHLSNTYSWNKQKFIRQLRLNLAGGKAFQVNGDSFFLNRPYIPIKECNCLYNEKAPELKQRFSNLDYYRPPDNRFSCFVYKCFKEGIILAIFETQVVYLKEWELGKYD